jgi:catechol 2,3-dioxygenase-like lactoylglutathione lyase family enzyme
MPWVRAKRFCSSADRRPVILSGPQAAARLWDEVARSRIAQYGESKMFSHIMIGSNDIARSKKFYDALFTAMGAQPATEDARGRLAYSHNGGRFMVTKPIDGKPATVQNGGTIGFLMSDAAQAKAWHDAGVANGGTSIEEPPGVRPNGAYLAYLRDPDGHKLVGVAR